MSYINLKIVILNLSLSSAMGSIFISLGLPLLILGVIYANVRNSFFISWEIALFQSSCLEFLIVLDYIRLIFMGSVAVVAGAVLIFSRTYMEIEKFFTRFHLLIVRFVASIFFLIISPNLIRVLLGWDGLGVTSFLLVVYFQRSKSFNAGMLTVLSNRIGDLFILLSIAFSREIGDWNIFIQRSINHTPRLVALCVIIRAFTKSAQIPFSAWLPAAIAAPTPVSSLVHSSTLVTAGVYLIIRLSFLVESFELDFFILLIGSMTILMAGVRAIFEVDMKKIVALSTLSQLGLIISSLGVGAWKVAFVHLISHAYFKALLFIAVGNMIHLSDDFQDCRKARYSHFSSLTLIFSMLANLSLCGFPFLAGFFSKDWVIESRIEVSLSLVALIVFHISTAITTIYSIRFIFLTRFLIRRRTNYSWEKDEDVIILVCCSILVPLVILGGGILVWSSQVERNLSILRHRIKCSVLFIIVLGCVLSFIVRFFYGPTSIYLGAWSIGLMWSLPNISSNLYSKFCIKFSFHRRQLDLTWIDHSTKYFTTGNNSALPEPLSILISTFSGATIIVIAISLILLIYKVELLFRSPES